MTWIMMILKRKKTVSSTSSDDESGLNLVDYDPYAGIDFSSSGDEL